MYPKWLYIFNYWLWVASLGVFALASVFVVICLLVDWIGGEVLSYEFICFLEKPAQTAISLQTLMHGSQTKPKALSPISRTTLKTASAHFAAFMSLQKLLQTLPILTVTARQAIMFTKSQMQVSFTGLRVL